MSQLGRISGPLLKANLLRQGVDLAFETDLLYLDVTNLRVGIKTTSPTHDLQVVGTTKTTNLEVDDQLDIGNNLTFTNNTISTNTGDITISAATGNTVFNNKIIVDKIDIEQNIISTNTTNENLEIRTSGTGQVEIYANTLVDGTLHVTGNITADGDIQLGDANTDNITFNADVASNIIPDQNEFYTLGSDPNLGGKRWLDVWANTLYADTINTGTAIIDGVDVGLNQGNIIYVAANGDDTYTGTHQNDPFGTVAKALSEAVSGDTVFIYPGTYQEVFPLTVPAGVVVKGTGIRSVKIVPTSTTRYNDAFLLNGETTVEDITVADFFSGGNYYTVTGASLGSTTINVGTAPFAHAYVSGGTIKIGSTNYNITNAVYTHTSGVLVLTHTGGTATLSSSVFVSNLTFSCNGGTRVFPDNGYAFRFATDFEVTTRSPYIRNISVLTKGSVTTLEDPLGFNSGDAGKGAYIDGAYALSTSNEASMLFHSVTFITPGVDAVTATNGVRIEWLNCFSYYANKGMNLFASNDGFAGDGKTRVKISNRTGTWNIGNTLFYYDTDGTTVLASGVIESIDNDKFIIDGKVLGFETPSDRDSKTASVFGNAKLSTSIKKFGTASLSLDGVGDYISYASQPDFEFGTGDFCLEVWVYPTSTGAYRTVFDLRTASPADGGGIILGITDANALYFYHNFNFRIGPVGTVPINTWTHVALSRVSGSTRAFINGAQVGSTYSDSNNYAARPFRIGADPNGSFAFQGYFDDVRVSNGSGRYSSNFASPTAAFTSDASTILLLHFNGTNNSTAIADDGVTTQDLRTSDGGSASVIDLVDYSDFGVEVRSIGSAAVYGNYGVYGDGDGVIGYLIGQNLAYIGNGKETTNDATTVIQENEVVELNRAKIYYSSVDHKGDFRIGDLFYVNQETGEVTFSNTNIDFTGGVTFDDGFGNITVIDATKVQTGNIRISGNTIESILGEINFVSANDQLNFTNNVNVTGDVDVVGNVTIGGNIQIGDANTDSVNIVAKISSDLVPRISDTYNLGTSLLRWQTLFSTQITTDAIDINDNRIRTINSNSDLELEANGTGRIYIPANNVLIDQNLTVNTTTNLKNTNVVGTVTHTGTLLQTGDTTQTGNINLTGQLTVSDVIQFEDIKIDGNVITTTIGNNDLRLEAAGTGRIYVPNNDVVFDKTLTVVGTTTTSNINNSDTITSATLRTSDIRINGNRIDTTTSNSNLELRANGTGFVIVEGFDVQENEIRSNNNADITLTPNGTGIVTVNSTQSIQIPVGATGDRPAGANGMIRYNTDLTRYEGYNNGNWLALSGVEDADGNTKITAELTPGANDNTIRFYTDGVVVADLNSTRLNANNIDVDDINISGNTVSTTTTDTNLILAPNGTGSVVIGDFAIRNNTITNTVIDSITTFNQVGGGYFKIAGTNGFVIPVGSDEQRPGIVATGLMRYNTTGTRVEIYDGSQWVSVAGSSGGISVVDAEDLSIRNALIFG